MQTRPLVPTGLLLVALAGCQSYFPNGYGAGGPYPTYPPPGAYSPPPGTIPPNGAMPPATTYQPGRIPPNTNGRRTSEVSPQKNDNYQPDPGQKKVPQYDDPGSSPATLGTPLDDDETIRRGTSQRATPPARLDSLTDDSEEAMAAFGDEHFEAPQPIAAASAIDDGDEMPRNVRKPPRDLYKYDREGYSWLRGVATRDPQGNGWRIQYSDDPSADERFGGSLLLVGDDKIDNLREDDTIRVEGRIDAAASDRYGKPVFRVDNLKWMKRKGQ